MHQQPTDPATEVKRLQRCMSDLVSVLALPAVWSGSEPSRILDTLLDALLVMLDLDFLYARVRLDSHGASIDALKTAQLSGTSYSGEEIGQALKHWFGEDPQRWPEEVLRNLEEQEVSAFPLRMGIEGELGLIVAGSQRLGFPEQTDRLILGVAANQLAIGLQQALLLNQQKRVASELDRRVAQRTEELKWSEARHRVVVETASDAVVSMDENGIITLANPATNAIFGYEPAQLIGKPLALLMPESLRKTHETGYKHYLETGERRLNWQGTELVARRANGSEFPVEVSFGEMIISGKKVFTGFIRDISEKKRVEADLRESERNFRLIVDTIPGLVCTLKPNWEVEQVNQPLRDYFGKTLEELKDLEFTDVVHPDDLDLVVAKCRYSVETGEPYEIEHRCRRFDGVFQWFQVRAMPLKDMEGRVVRWYLLLIDIEDRKGAEVALRTSERNLSLIINTIPTTAWSTRPDGYCDFLSDRWLNYAGFTFEQAVGWNWAAAIHPDDAERLREHWQSCLASGTPLDTEARIRRFDGVYRWFLFRANPFRDESGIILKWYGSNIDIDDRKRAEEALRIRELNLRQITETIPEMLWSASPDGAIDYCNGRLLDYTGLSSKQVMRDGWMNLLHPDDVEQTAEVWKSCVKSGAPYRVEVRTFHAADDTYRWCVTSALPLLDQEGRIVKWHGTVVDMHDWKQAQEELRNTQAELAKMMRIMTIGQLTASIAHEVSQPLSGIITNASTCLRMLKSDPPNVDGARETAQRTIRDGNRATDVVTRLRTLFSKKQINIEPVDLNEATREVIALLLGELQKNRVIVQSQFNDNLPTVKGDRIQLQQVLLNLLRNALDAMGTVNDRPRRLFIRTDADGDHVTVFVQDSGVGFDPEKTDRLFESFFTTKQEGMGVGLSLSRSIVEAHRGHLWAARNDGPGSTFAFSIPCDSGSQIDSAS
jgi:PAS domain S-box-containing protein